MNVAVEVVGECLFVCVECGGESRCSGGTGVCVCVC